MTLSAILPAFPQKLTQYIVTQMLDGNFAPIIIAFVLYAVVILAAIVAVMVISEKTANCEEVE